MSHSIKLYDLAKVLRSKNAGPFELTLDIMFDEPAKYQLVKDARIIDKTFISQLYQIPLIDVYHVVFYDPALAIKITIKRPIASGNIGDTDVYGAQQHAPLMGVLIPLVRE